VKDKIGTGYWSRNKHELLLIGTRGHVPAPSPGAQWPSVIEAPVREHSRKPDQVYELIEAYFPTLPKIELHARGAVARPGWDVWGLEAPTEGGDADEIEFKDDGVDIFDDPAVVDAIDAFEDAAAYEMEDAHETR
jgi:N6-adenosine-specific RNA methylase IME4